ncbi:MAG: hypothetical protein RBG1_1C00001G0427 [candidate division Zixibacteria bacterium RBG-1]|nr:MAG: hypothetical protein RBG1_1C00001G0427 [candidate division Zixibacteria bacterium RBG-1]OGC84765.1 MAG: AAA family ATPase [candidate division Zixibacteria bacterium RBG_19FT_COMBO_42_43]
MDLFGKTPLKKNALTPLADRIRPEILDEFVGQKAILGEGSILRKAILEDKISSLIFWGPPGCGKTTLARLMAKTTQAYFISFSAVTSSIKEVKEVIVEATKQKDFYNKKTILFIDEIHRFNKAQQDAFLPYVEKGSIILIGATTENPSFEVISPLLSRCQVYVLKQLQPEEMKIILNRAISDKEKGLGSFKLKISDEALEYMAQMSNGDARVALNSLEFAVNTAKPDKDEVRKIDLKIVQEAMQKKALLYDKSGEEHYNIISAFIKSLRGSDPDAALYWMFRMLEAGEDPLYLARRMVILASEDIGNADPQALQVAVAAKEAVEFVGLPEGEFALAQAAIYLATAPKSNAVYEAMNKVKKEIKETQALPVPLHIRNAPTPLMEKLGYGKNYQYPHDFPQHFVSENYLPEGVKQRKYYTPGDLGFEEELKKRIENLEQMNKKVTPNSATKNKKKK